MTIKKTLLVIMDGVGESQNTFGNAVENAWKPQLHWLKSKFPHTLLGAHGTWVGLPSDADMGNSEVGHNALGAGRIYTQGAKLVQDSIASGQMFKDSVWQKVLQTTENSTLHFIGLLSDGNVHSHEQHLFAMLRNAVQNKIKKIRIHILLDGRDVAEKSAEIYVERLEKIIQELKGQSTADIKIASGGGRMNVTMDRYGADWSIVERGWHVHVLGNGLSFRTTDEYLKKMRDNPNLTDQNFPPFVIAENNLPVGEIKDGDGVVFFNFRGDRAIEISRAFEEDQFKPFDRKRFPKVFYAGMMQYDGDLHIPKNFLVHPPAIQNTLAEYMVEQKIMQFACSETQKYGHVTYFWNGNRSGYLNQKWEEYVEIPSDQKISFDAKPWMKCVEITDATIERMRLGAFDFGRINFANGDMVGHTGDYAATQISVEAVDLMIGRLATAAALYGYQLLITADHGNAEEMFDDKESKFPHWKENLPTTKPRPKTSHTLNPVIFLACDFSGENNYLFKKNKKFGLGNVAATVLDIMGVPFEKSHFDESVIQ